VRKLFGVVTPMITPFKKNEDIDTAALRALTIKLINSGVNGLYPCGTTGEGHLMSNEERKLVAETVVDETNSRVPVYIQSGAMSFRDTLELSKHALECGADGIGVVTPSYYTLSQETIRDFYISLAKELPDDFPIYMYSIPGNALNDILPETAAEIARKCSNVVGIKYSGDDFVQLQAYTGIREGTFSVLAGNDKSLAAVLADGCSGTVSGLSNLFSTNVISVYKAFISKDIDSAIRLQGKVYRDSLCLFNGFFLANLKAAMGISGMPVGKLRKPLPELTDTQFRQLEKSISNLNIT